MKIDPLTNLPMRSEFVKDFHEMMKNSKDMEPKEIMVARSLEFVVFT